jgi:hypothetical protein
MIVEAIVLGPDHRFHERRGDIPKSRPDKPSPRVNAQFVDHLADGPEYGVGYRTR